MITDIHPRVSVNAGSSRGWSLDDDIEFWAANGITRVGLQWVKIEAAGAEHTLEAIARSGFTVTNSSIPSGLVLGDTTGLDAARELYCRRLDLASQLGAHCVYTLTGPTQSRMTTDEGTARFVEAIGPVVAHADAIGMPISLEHSSTMTREKGCVQSFRDTVSVAREAGMGVCVELQNCWMERGLGELFQEGADLLTLVQVNDFVVGTPERLSRAVLGDGDMPLEWLLGALLDAGYDGVFDIEIMGPRIEAEGYASAIGRSVDWLSGWLVRHCA